MHVEMPTRRFTVEEYQRMAEAGNLGEDDRVELIDGRIVEMTPIGERHAACVRRLTNLLAERARGRAIVDVQDPVYLDRWSLPQPDVTLLRPRSDFYTSHPRPEDLLLVVEVADTSLRYDRDEKFPRYAAGGITEAWLVDLEGDRIEVHREPRSGGLRASPYRQARRRTRGRRASRRDAEGRRDPRLSVARRVRPFAATAHHVH